MQTQTYQRRREQLEAYFDRTAAGAWAALTSDQPVSRIRATVRAGRDKMRSTILGYLPDDLAGRRVLDAGCGTGALAMEAARRGAEVVAVDISETLVALARQRTKPIAGGGSVDFRVGDMLDPALGFFDYVVAMDSLIHYGEGDVLAILRNLALRSEKSVVITFAPSTPLLKLMHAAGKLFPRGDRSPSLEPIASGVLRRRVCDEPGLRHFTIGRSERIDSAFYVSQTLELVRS